MISMPHTIDDALDLEPMVLDMLDSWNNVSADHRVQETLCGTEFYQGIQRCKDIIKMIEAWRYDYEMLNIDNRIDQREGS
tara:strand:+ start:405 stop:644 length:240 start_codon:yes stop_codon:yes gene_type:complete